MLNITICDDEHLQIEYLAALVRKWADERGRAVRISNFESAENFLFSYEDDKTADILLLDIQMKELDGVELARQIRQDNDAVQIIFITGYLDFISEGYDVSALHYLIKPAKEDKLFEVLDRAVSRLQREEKSLLIDSSGEKFRIKLDDIRFIEAQDHYVCINTNSGDYKVKMRLSDIEKMLDGSFIRCQRSFIIGLKHIKKTTKLSVVLQSNKEIPISRSMYDVINTAIINYFK